MIRVERARKLFHAGSVDERAALDGITLELTPGAFAVVIGSNGAGKSTLLNAVAGTVTLDEGSVRVGADDVTRWPVHRRARLVARVLQDPMLGTLPELTVEENLALAEMRAAGRGLRPALGAERRRRFATLLAPYGLGLEARLGARAGLLSGGQRQVLALAMAVIRAPRVLLLDEHAAALDPKTADLVMAATVRAVQAGGLTTLMVTHNMQHAIRYGDRLLMMDAGRIRLDLAGADKGGLTVEQLVERFHLADDKVLLSVTELLASFWNLVPITLVQGLLYGFIALAVMIPFRLLAFPDLTSEGAFPLGGCLCAALLLAGANPLLATLGAMAGGMLAGLATAFVHLRFRINTLLAGILVMTILYSVNLRVLGKSNAALLGLDSLLSWISPAVIASVPLQVAVFAVLGCAVLGALYWFLGTEVGLSLRAVGANAALAPALAINPWSYILGGLALASGLSALAGAVAVQLQGFADVHMGFGVLITGLASVIIGETLIGRRSVARQLAAPVLGSIVYYQLVSLGLALGLKPADLKLATGLFVLATLALPALRRGAEPEKLRE